MVEAHENERGTYHHVGEITNRVALSPEIGLPILPRARGGAYLEFVPFGLTRALTLVLHI